MGEPVDLSAHDAAAHPGGPAARRTRRRPAYQQAYEIAVERCSTVPVD
ncbi:hypothetical protein ACGFNV_18940 [Streptomyces sp. NPDC048751]